MASHSRGNSRIAKLQRFLRLPPPGQATQLVLAVALDEELETLHVWTREQVTKDASDIAALVHQECEDIAEEIGHAVTGQLAWCDPGGTRIAVKPLRVLPQDPMRTEFSGTNLDQARQAQRHLEAMTRLFVQSIQSVTELQSKMMGALVGRIADVDKRERRREQEALGLVSELQEQVAELQGALDESSKPDSGDQLLQVLQPAITAFVAGKMTPPTPTQPPKKPASESK